MAVKTVQPWTGTPTGINVYAYPLSNAYPIAQWATHRVLLPDQEGSRPITLDDDKGLYWGLFEGNTQPSDKSKAVATVSLEENGSTAFPAGLTVAIPSVLENANYDPFSIVRYRGTTWVVTFETLGVLSNISQLWFTLRKRHNDSDSNSLLQISLTGGLIISNGSGTNITSSNGSVTVTDNVNGTVVVLVKPSETTKLPIMDNLNYDLKVVRSNGDVDLIHESNKFRIARDVTRRVSNA
jgi:hypothetical protein